MQASEDKSAKTTTTTEKMACITSNFGFLGCGRLGVALLEGWLVRGALTPGRVFVSAFTSGEATAARFAQYNVRSVTPEELVEQCDVVTLAVKPHQMANVTTGLPWRDDQIVISVAAGVPHATLLDCVRPATRVVRTMPNVAASVGASATLVLSMPTNRDGDVALVKRLFEYIGSAEVLSSEEQLHAATAIAGCGPAYFFLAMEAMSDAGVAAGLPRDVALRLAAGAVSGAGQLALKSNTHPALLKDSVTSSGGVTIQAVRALEQRGFRSALLEAVLTATERSQAMCRAATDKS